MLELIVVALSVLLYPFIIYRTDKNGILFCIIALTIVLSTIVFEIISVIVKINTGEVVIFNLLMIILQMINIASLTMSLYAHRERNKNNKSKYIEDIVV